MLDSIRKGELYMLQSIQFIGSGPPTYIYTDQDETSGVDFRSVLATETRGYNQRQSQETARVGAVKKRRMDASLGNDEVVAFAQKYEENLQNMYQMGYGKRDVFLWKQS